MITKNSQNDLIIYKSSPVKGHGLDVPNPKEDEDIDGNLFNTPRSIGAKEVNPKIDNIENIYSTKKLTFPNPTSDFLLLNFESLGNLGSPICIEIYNVYGDCEMSLGLRYTSTPEKIDISFLNDGVYLIKINNHIESFVVVK